MLKNTLLTLLLATAVTHGAIREVLPNLTSNDLDLQTQARLKLHAVCAEAAKPDNEAARIAVCQEICTLLQEPQPPITVLHPLLLNLERIGNTESVPTLVLLLNHDEKFIRDDARRALTVNAAPEAGQALTAQLQAHPPRPAAETAGFITALGERKEANSSKWIAPYLNHNDDLLFTAAVKALGQLNEAAGIDALMQQRPQATGNRKTQLDAALLATNRKAVFEQLYTKNEPAEVRAAALLGLLLLGETDLADTAMASGNADQQIAVIEAAAQGHDPSVYNAVAEQIGFMQPHIQLQALGALEFSGNRAYAKAVEPLLQSPDPVVQDNASCALARIGTAASVTALMANGRPAARRALARLNVKGVDQALEQFAAEGEDARRATAINALAGRGRTDLLPVFFTYAEGEAEATSQAAIEAIGKIGGLPNLEPMARLLIEKEETAASRTVLSALVNLARRSTNPAKVVEILMKKMEGAPPRRQANLLQVLVQTESKETIPPLVNACRSDHPQLKKTAVKLLSGWKNNAGLPAMIKLAGDPSTPLADHVNLMRGISRLLAAQPVWEFQHQRAEQARQACRRDQERKAIQDTINKVNKKK